MTSDQLIGIACLIVMFCAIADLFSNGLISDRIVRIIRRRK